MILASCAAVCFDEIFQHIHNLFVSADKGLCTQQKAHRTAVHKQPAVAIIIAVRQDAGQLRKVQTGQITRHLRRAIRHTEGVLQIFQHVQKLFSLRLSLIDA